MRGVRRVQKVVEKVLDVNLIRSDAGGARSNSVNVECDRRVIFVCLSKAYGVFEENMHAGHNAIQRRPDALAPCLRVSSGGWLHSWVAPPSTSRCIAYHEENHGSRSQYTMRTG